MKTGIEKAEREFEEMIGDIVDKCREYAGDYNVPVRGIVEDVAKRMEKVLEIGKPSKKKPLTREQFLAQFPYRVETRNIKDILTFDAKMTMLAPDGVKVFTALNKILVKVNGEFYASK